MPRPAAIEHRDPDGIGRPPAPQAVGSTWAPAPFPPRTPQGPTELCSADRRTATSPPTPKRYFWGVSPAKGMPPSEHGALYTAAQVDEAREVASLVTVAPVVDAVNAVLARAPGFVSIRDEGSQQLRSCVSWLRANDSAACTSLFSQFLDRTGLPPPSHGASCAAATSSSSQAREGVALYLRHPRTFAVATARTFELASDMYDAFNVDAPVADFITEVSSTWVGSDLPAEPPAENVASRLQLVGAAWLFRFQQARAWFVAHAVGSAVSRCVGRRGFSSGITSGSGFATVADPGDHHGSALTDNAAQRSRGLRAVALARTLAAVGAGKGPSGELDDGQLSAATQILRRAAASDPLPNLSPAACGVPVMNPRPPLDGALWYWSSTLAGLSRRVAGDGADGRATAVAQAAAHLYMANFVPAASYQNTGPIAHDAAERLRQRFAVMRPREPAMSRAADNSLPAVLPASAHDALYRESLASLRSVIDAMPWPRQAGAGPAAPSMRCPSSTARLLSVPPSTGSECCGPFAGSAAGALSAPAGVVKAARPASDVPRAITAAELPGATALWLATASGPAPEDGRHAVPSTITWRASNEAMQQALDRAASAMARACAGLVPQVQGSGVQASGVEGRTMTAVEAERRRMAINNVAAQIESVSLSAAAASSTPISGEGGRSEAACDEAGDGAQVASADQLIPTPTSQDEPLRHQAHHPRLVLAEYAPVPSQTIQRGALDTLSSRLEALIGSTKIRAAIRQKR